MKAHGDTKATETQISTRPNVRISAENFGPIVNGSIDLRPLTVFVGPSNTGKTYLATLIYALHKILPDFSLLPVMYQHLYRFVQDLGDTKTSTGDAYSWKVTLQDIVEKLETKGRRFMFADLPEPVRERWQIVLTDNEVLGESLTTELGRCFGIQSVSELVRLSGNSDSAELSLSVSEECQPFWHFNMNISKSDITTDGQIQDMVLFPDGGAVSNRWGHTKFRKLVTKTVGEFFEELLYSATWNDRRDQTHYLPAARSGIMLSHRLISSSLVANATRAGLDPFPEIPTFSGVVADFMQQLILYEEQHTSDNLMKDFADVLEREVLDGQIRVNRASAGGYPDFVYQPRKTEENIRLARASSMVTELAPVVLLLRNAIARGDMLIIEEPEAHLHPAAQAEMAKALGRLVRAGVQVVVTTHSDWLLMEIANLIREGELEEKIGEPDSENLLPSSLQPSDVGVWLFGDDGTSSGSTVEEIPFDRIEGVEPREYEDVAEALYNRSAGLQNRLAESVK